MPLGIEVPQTCSGDHLFPIKWIDKFLNHVQVNIISNLFPFKWIDKFPNLVHVNKIGIQSFSIQIWIDNYEFTKIIQGLMIFYSPKVFNNLCNSIKKYLRTLCTSSHRNKVLNLIILSDNICVL